MTAPTIRTILGVPAPQRVDPKKSALLVIDFQIEYFTGRMPIPNGKTAMENTNRLIDMADRKNIPVYHIQHVAPAEAPIFAEGGETMKIHPDLSVTDKHKRVQKSSVSVFPTTDLNEQLRKDGVETLIVTGLMTHACVAGAARDAVPLGYEVIVVDDACATRDLDDGALQVSHTALHKAALATLADTFADIMSTDQVLKLIA